MALGRSSQWRKDFIYVDSTSACDAMRHVSQIFQVEEHRSGHVTGAPQYWRDRLYVPISAAEDGPSLNPKYECCTARGGVVALDVKTGKILWRTYSVTEEPHPTRKNAVGTQLWGPSGASIWAAPTIDAKRNRLYVGTGDNHSEPETKTSDAILAMDLDTGKIVWSKQLTEHDTFNIACVAVDQTNCPQPAGPDLDIGSSPMIVGNVLIVGQKSAVVHALDLAVGSLVLIVFGFGAVVSCCYRALQSRRSRRR